MESVFVLSYNGKGGAGWNAFVSRTMRTQEAEWWAERLYKQKQAEADAMERAARKSRG